VPRCDVAAAVTSISIVSHRQAAMKLRDVVNHVHCHPFYVMGLTVTSSSESLPHCYDSTLTSVGL
jgi:hypothetical protein